MRIALVADIHANLVSLEATLAHIAMQGVDEIVCLGDVASVGPQPRESLDWLRRLRCSMVMGNGEAQLREPIAAAPDTSDRVHKFIDIYVWCRTLLSDEDWSFMEAFAPTVTVPLSGDASLLCFHGSPHSYHDVIRATTPVDELDRMLGDTEATVMAGGHTHQPFVRRYHERILLNPGCVGVPLRKYRGAVDRAPWAEYATVTWDADHLGVELHRVPVDAQAVAEAALRSGMPHAEWWTAGMP